MDFLHRQVSLVEKQLAFVATDPIDWKFYVQVFSWGVCLFESYLLCVTYVSFDIGQTHQSLRLRQYPLYSKKTPPPALAQHFTSEVFEKSQNYGKEKAQFAFVSGIYRQVLDSLCLQVGMYAWAWDVAGRTTAKLGYGAEYEVRTRQVNLMSSTQ